MNPAKKIGLFVVAVLLLVLPVVSPISVRAADSDGGTSGGMAKPALIPTQNELESIYRENDVGDNPTWTMESYGMRKIFSDVGSVGYGIMGPTTGGGANAAVRAPSGDSGLVTQMGNAMSFMISQPPASAELWLADALHNSPLVPAAYAQGVGFKSLTPILPIWRTFRDLAYICFIFVFAAIGFAIMFRKKLGGQTVATISNAIPRLVVTLILITFSYAIAGLLIDVMYIVIYFISSVFTNLIDTTKSGDLVGIALGNSIFDNGWKMVFGGGLAVFTDGDATTNSVAGAAAQSVAQIVQGFFGETGLSSAVGNILGVGVNVVGFLIIALAIMFAVVKTFFELLKSYVTFIIMVIFSPFQLLLGAFKENGDVVQWLRNLTATLAPFPVVITMIFLAMTLGGYGKNGVGFGGGDVSGGFQPPQMRLPFVANSAGAVSAIQGLIVIGLLMLIPEAVEMSKKALKAHSPFEEFTKSIMGNLKKGWEGDKIAGLGPKIPGASQILPGMAKMGTSAAGGAAVGGFGGMVGGATMGANYAKSKGGGTGAQFISALAGGAAGGTLGAGVGAGVGIGAPVIKRAVEIVSPTIQKGVQFATNADKLSEKVIDLKRTSDAKARATEKRTPVPTTPTSRTMDQELNPNDR